MNSLAENALLPGEVPILSLGSFSIFPLASHFSQFSSAEFRRDTEGGNTLSKNEKKQWPKEPLFQSTFDAGLY